MISPTVL